MDFLFDSTFNGLDAAALLALALAAIGARRLLYRPDDDPEFPPPATDDGLFAFPDDAETALARDIRRSYDGLPYRGRLRLHD